MQNTCNVIKQISEQLALLRHLPYLGYNSVNTHLIATKSVFWQIVLKCSNLGIEIIKKTRNIVCTLSQKVTELTFFGTLRLSIPINYLYIKINIIITKIKNLRLIWKTYCVVLLTYINMILTSSWNCCDIILQ